MLLNGLATHSPFYLNVSRRYIQIFSTATSMKQYNARKLVGYSNEQMYSVVSDVKNYKKFIPFCTKSTILSKEPELLRANLEVGFPPIMENYTSVVSLNNAQMIKATCRDGKLFNFLESTWRFQPGLRSNPQSCIVDFSIRFEFRSPLYTTVATFFFEQLVVQMEQAFMKEAHRRFGKESVPVHILQPLKN